MTDHHYVIPVDLAEYHPSNRLFVAKHSTLAEYIGQYEDRLLTIDSGTTIPNAQSLDIGNYVI